MSGRTTSAPPRSCASGWRSCEKTTTSWPARLHSRASARVYTFDPVPPSRYPCQSRIRMARTLSQVEVERVEQLDGRVGRVDSNVLRHVEQRLGVVEDDLDPRPDEVVGDTLRVVGGNGDDADDDVLLADRVGEPAVVADRHVADRPPDLVGIRVEHRRDVDPVLREDRRARDRLAEPAGADERDVVLPLRPQDLPDLPQQRVDVVADAA